MFGIQAVRPLGTGPYDLTNVLLGGLYGFAITRLTRPGIRASFDEPELLLAMRVATVVAFILARLGTFFFMERTGNDPFIAIGYTHRSVPSGAPRWRWQEPL